jgi:putative membrane protein
VLLLALGSATVMYAVGLIVYWRRAGPGHGIRFAESAAFLAGMIALSVAMVWPLDVLGEWSLAMHMAQHMLLIAVVAPLIVLGRPGVVWLKALPAAWTSRVRSTLRAVKDWKRLATLAGLTTATSLQIVVMWGWHAPQAMQFALTNDLAHYAMHGSFLAAGLLFWWALLRSLRDGAAGFGAGAIALVGTMAQMGLLSALLTFSRRPLYPWYVERSGALGLTPLEDQQLAGLIMWVPGAVPYVIGALWLMASWLRRSERGDARRRRQGHA